MRISVHEGVNSQDPLLMSMGYNHASYKIVESLLGLGIDVRENDLSAPLKLSFTTPRSHRKENNQYIIGYSCHESSELPNSWAESFSKVDEMWSPSTFGLNTFKKYFGKRATTVFPLGISKEYAQLQRKYDRSNPFIFLHVGEPYQRKMGNLVAEAFNIAFSGRQDVKLIFKTYGSDWDGLPKHKIKYEYSNIEILSKNLTLKEYIDLLHMSNCLVLPSLGEGFGMITLEALATGMPIISTWEWAEYKDFIINRIESTPGPAPDFAINVENENQLVGNVFLPKLESVVEHMINVYENYIEQSEAHYQNSFKVHEEYSWDNVVRQYALPRLEKIYEDVT